MELPMKLEQIFGRKLFWKPGYQKNRSRISGGDCANDQINITHPAQFAGSLRPTG
jgi:hypothetical protein